MENKKTIIGIITVIILIIGLVIVSYLYNDFNTKQVKILTDETNILLQADILEEDIQVEIKTEENYAIVEKAIKEYVLKLKNIYVEIAEINTQINPDNIFSGENVQDKEFDKVDTIISDYKEKGKSCLEEYQLLVTEQKILEYIEEKNISFRGNYYVDLYKTAMLSEVMKQKFTIIEAKIEEQKDKLYTKLSQLEKIEEFLKENEKYWKINEDGKIEITNTNKMIEYYNLINDIEN